MPFGKTNRKITPGNADLKTRKANVAGDGRSGTKMPHGSASFGTDDAAQALEDRELAPIAAKLPKKKKGCCP